MARPLLKSTPKPTNFIVPKKDSDEPKTVQNAQDCSDGVKDDIRRLTGMGVIVKNPRLKKHRKWMQTQ